MPDPGAILITGCSSGIGRAATLRLARGGHTVYATARRLDGLEELEQAGCRLLTLDVTDEASMTAAVDAVVSEAGAVGSLVNNAGYSQSGAIETVQMDAVRRQFETNVFGLIRMSQLVLPGMRERGRGRIVNISSMGANFTFPGGGLYHATKYAVEAVSDALRFEVRGFGVDVVVVQPGMIRTSFGETAAHGVQTETDGAYAKFNREVAKATEDVYKRRSIAWLGGGPETVAKTIEQAITAKRPKTRYRVTPSAKLMITQRKLMTDGMWDRMMRVQFPQPGK